MGGSSLLHGLTDHHQPNQIIQVTESRFTHTLCFVVWLNHRFSVINRTLPPAAEPMAIVGGVKLCLLSQSAAASIKAFSVSSCLLREGCDQTIHPTNHQSNQPSIQLSNHSFIVHPSIIILLSLGQQCLEHLLIHHEHPHVWIAAWCWTVGGARVPGGKPRPH